MDAREACEWMLVGHLSREDLIESIREWREVARKHPREQIRKYANQRVDALLTEAKRRNLTIPDEDTTE